MTQNIPTIGIMIKPRHYKKLMNNVWNERLLPSKLVIDGNKYESGITYRGDHIRTFPKKSYRIKFEGYNQEYSGNEIHLNAEYRDPSLIRNKLSFDFFQTIGCLAPDSRHVFVELNGKPEGIYLQLESVDQWFLQKRQLPDGPIFYATTYEANFSLLTPEDGPKSSLFTGYDQKVGSEKDIHDLETFIAKINTIPREKFGEEITKYLDVKKYLIWLCGAVCTQNFDGFIHNYSLYRNSETGLFEMIPWDYDATWGRDWDGEIMEYNYVPARGYNTLTARLLDHKEFRDQYRLMLEEILDTSFTIGALEPKVTNMYNQLRTYITLDPHKSRKSINLFEKEPELILQFISNRNRYLLEQLKNLT